LGVGLAAALAIGAAGCDPFTRLDFTDQTSVPSDDQVRFEQIRLTEGRAIGVIAKPMQGDEPMDDDTTVELASHDADIAGVGPSIKKHSFVVFGAGRGTTSFSVTVNGNVERDIPVEVEEAR
jgi:hypothetical protein